MKFKEYKRQYRHVFSSKKRYEDYLKKDKIEFKDNNPKSLLQFTKQMKTLMWDAEMRTFDTLIKFVWLMGRLEYGGVSSLYTTKSKGFQYNRAVSILFKNDIGFSPGMLLGNGSGWVRHIVTYFKDFFPFFFEDNPFEEKYEYPYKYMNLECLFMVYKMDTRLELLKIGEERKMTYAEFLDYVLNHVYCINDELGYKKYRFSMSPVILPYVTFFKEKKYGKRKRRKSKASNLSRG